MRVFVAGAGGAIGRPLIRQLVHRGHEVSATTRKRAKLPELRALGAEAGVMDGLDAESVRRAVAQAEPEVIVHQMTALAGSIDLKHWDDSFASTNDLRTRGTENLIAAGEAVGIRHFLAQGYTGWPNVAENGSLVTEEDPFNADVPAAMQRTVDAFRRQEKLLAGASFDTAVLRYGSFYGPRATDEMVELLSKRKVPQVGDGAGVWSWIHVEDAAAATVAAVEARATGIFNVVDDEPARVSEWLPCLAEAVQAKRPLRVPVWLARLAAGQTVVYMMTQIPGATNAKAKRELAWRPRWPSWRRGFQGGLHEPNVLLPAHA